MLLGLRAFCIKKGFWESAFLGRGSTPLRGIKVVDSGTGAGLSVMKSCNDTVYSVYPTRDHHSAGGLDGPRQTDQFTLFY